MSCIKMEHKVLSEFMILYKEQPCLWDTTHKLYTNKLARDRALDVLLVKFKELNPLADKAKMKKKIENLRTTYKRERAKVIRSNINDEPYEPTLWYYSTLSFLDEHEKNHDVTSNSTSNVNDCGNDDNDDDAYSMEYVDSPSSPPGKRSKQATIYLNESDDNDFVIEQTVSKTSPTKPIKVSKSHETLYTEDKDLYQEEPSCSVKNEPSELYLNLPAESDLYAKTISSQLNELRPKQRFIAEKLISEIIFYGRLDKLKTGTSLNLNTDI